MSESRQDLYDKKFASYFRLSKANAIAEVLIEDPETKTLSIYQALRCYTESIAETFMEDACEILDLNYEKADFLDRVTREKLQIRPREDYMDKFVFKRNNMNSNIDQLIEEVVIQLDKDPMDQMVDTETIIREFVRKIINERTN